MPDLKRDVPDVVGRREFTLQSALALLATVVITVDGCGGSTSAPSPTAVPAPAPAPGAAAADVNGTISANHGHVAVISSAQITAANAFSLNIMVTPRIRTTSISRKRTWRRCGAARR